MKVLSAAALAVFLVAPRASAVNVRGAALLPGSANSTVLAHGDTPSDISAADLEKSLTAMLRDRANPAVADFVQKISVMLGGMKTTVRGQHKALQAELKMDAFAACGTGLSTRQDLAKSIPAKLASLSKDHQTCRKDEETVYTAGLDCYKLEKTQRELQKSTSGALSDLEKTLTQRPEDWPNTCKVNNGESFDKYTGRLADFFSKQLQSWKEKKAAADDASAKLKAQEGKCDTSKAQHEAKRTSCDKAQQELDAASCGYYDSVSQSCKTYSTCYDTASAAFKTVRASVQKQEKSYRTQFESILRMECLVAAFLATDEVAAMQACSQQNYTKGSAELALTYPADPPKVVCPLPTDTAGTDAYVAVNYKPLPVNAPAAACTASCCKPATVVRPTLTRELAPSVANTRSPGVANTGSPGVANTGSPGVANTGSPGLANTGSPDKDCNCRSIDLKGKPWAAGALVSCTGTGCKEVKRSTEANSCPKGWKIFSPQSRSDWQTLIDLKVIPVANPDFIVDVTRPKNGCGGCTDSPMNSATAAQSSWVTTDGSPWWLRGTKFSEPNGDYTANCYLLVYNTTRADDIRFNDGGCAYRSKSYLCQPTKSLLR